MGSRVLLLLVVVVFGVGVMVVGGSLGRGEVGYRNTRRPLTEEKKVELAASRLEQLIRNGNLASLVTDQKVEYGQGSVAKSPEQVLSKLEEMMADFSEDPREKPIVDIVVRRVEVNGNRAVAHITARVAHRIDTEKTLTESYNMQLEFVKRGRGWSMVFGEDLLEVVEGRRKVLKESYRGTVP